MFQYSMLTPDYTDHVRESPSALSNITDFWPSPEKASRLIDRVRRPAAQAVAILSLGAAALVRRLDDCVADDLARSLARPSSLSRRRWTCSTRLRPFPGARAGSTLLGRSEGARPFELHRWRVDRARIAWRDSRLGPAVTAWAVDEMQVFAIFPDHQLWNRYWDGATGTRGSLLGGELAGARPRRRGAPNASTCGQKATTAETGIAGGTARSGSRGSGSRADPGR